MAGRKGLGALVAAAGRMGIAWLITLPMSALVGIICWWIAHGIGIFTSDLIGVLVAFAILIGLSFYMWRYPQRDPLTPPKSTRTDEETNGVVPPRSRKQPLRP